ncbi:P1 family peptidase [uncultured Hyphomonas sp.]|uniref:P1 family peptidase n=1 Tax=uncultured Hyphomonas sp. TaxID=225298 RepID=UPI002AAC2A0E|nr:P1 family peptidase [uncultured Hyphomonas sp.]
MATTAGKWNLITDVPGVRIGQAQDARVNTGVTVILPDTPVVAACAVAGGGPGTRETDLLSAGAMVDRVDAVFLSGGSAFGLGAADGVMAGLKQAGRGFSLVDRPGVPPTPIVPGAILYDLANGGDKTWDEIAPYAALGLEAFRSAGKDFELGRAGAGHGARAGQHSGGTGSASIVAAEGITVGAIACVNSFGSVLMPGTDAYWAWPYELAGEFGGGRPPADFIMDPEDWGAAKANPVLGQNTTIACIATDAALTPAQAQRVAQMALSGFSRAIRPVFAPFDGDAVFVLSTANDTLPVPDPLTVTRIGELAASTLARAITRGVHEARRQTGAVS